MDESDDVAQPFRFLTRKEYARLDPEQQKDYVRRALRAIERGDPLDRLPVGEWRQPPFERPKSRSR